MPQRHSAATTGAVRRRRDETPATTGYARPMVYQDEAERRLQRFLGQTFPLRAYDAVLDVGCGYVLPIDIPSDVWLVGLDADPAALAKNLNIDEAIEGDIAEVVLPEEEFAAVLCWNVLEHLRRPRPALAAMARALRPGGVLVVGVPNRWSLKGLITRLTPYSFHVWVYRRLLGSPRAGTPGFGPYRTYFARDTAPRRLTAFAAALRLERVYEDTHGRVPPLPGVLRAWWRAVARLVWVATLGRWDPLKSELILVFRKRRG